MERRRQATSLHLQEHAFIRKVLGFGSLLLSAIIHKPCPSRADGTLSQGSGAAAYIMSGCQRHWIPDVATFNAHGYKWSAVQHVADADLQAIPVGAQIPLTTDTLTANRSDQVGSGFFMQSNVNVVKQNGLINVVTHTWDTNAYAGFTGGVQVWLIDKNGVILAITQMHTFSVGGRYVFFNQGSRWDQWSEQVDPKIASQTAAVQIVQLLSPVNRPVTDPHFVGSAAKTVKNVLCTAYPTLAICKS